jgi:hypothetical protein
LGIAPAAAKRQQLMKQYLKDVFKAFWIELPLYAALVVAYGFFVLHYLGGWLFHLFIADRKLYAITALALIVGQGFLLENLARALLGLVKGKREK